MNDIISNMCRKVIIILAAVLTVFSLCAVLSSCESYEFYDTVNYASANGRITYELYGKDGCVKKIRVSCEDAKTGKVKSLGSYKAEGIDRSELSDGSYGFEVIDLNFDGLPDFRIIHDITAYGDNILTKYSNYLCNSDGTYYARKDLGSIGNVEPDNDTKTLKGQNYAKIFEGKNEKGEYVLFTETISESVYEWRGTTLTEIRRHEVKYYSESDIYCIADYEINDGGTLEAVDEKWIEADKYKENKK